MKEIITKAPITNAAKHSYRFVQVWDTMKSDIKFFTFLLLIFNSNVLLGQNSDDSNNRKDYNNYTDAFGLKQGKWIISDSNNIVTSELYFLNNKLNGVCSFFWGNGVIKEKSLYKNGKHWEVLEAKDSLGNSLDPGNLKDGNGTLKYYYSNGIIRWEQDYKDGVMFGLTKLYTDKGVLTAEGVSIDFDIPETYDTVIVNDKTIIATKISTPQNIGLWKHYDYFGERWKDEIYDGKGKLIYVIKYKNF